MDKETIKAGIAKEAFEAKASRDRLNALHLLGKAKGMFKDVIEHKHMRTDEEFLRDLSDALGNEAARVAAEELGLEWNEETIK